MAKIFLLQGGWLVLLLLASSSQAFSPLAGRSLSIKLTHYHESSRIRLRSVATPPLDSQPTRNNNSTYSSSAFSDASLVDLIPTATRQQQQQFKELQLEEQREKLEETLTVTANLPRVSDEKKEPLLEPLGRGIARDYRARLPLYWSDICDGLNPQCVAAVLFMFFACLSPAVAFGAMYDSATQGAIGTVEMVGSTALCGVLYALTAAQPLTIIGSTGPVLSFVACLAQLAKTFQLPFLPLYAWTGLWTSGILLACSVTSASNLVKYLTRFTDEIFSTLISVIFVVEALAGVFKPFAAGSLNTALLTATCAAMTYTLSSVLKKVRRSTFFTKQIRTTVSNFAPTLGVLGAASFARWARVAHGAALPALAMPQAFGTTTGRPWLVPLMSLPVWARVCAVVPALMASVLLFLDQDISVRLVNNPKWGMKKGRRPNNVVDGMHADMLIISLLTALQSVLGLPWLVAATVRSISHVSALSEFDEHGMVRGTKEQRVTGAAIHGLIGLSILFDKPRQLLSQVPLPVLLGLFMYLGVTALPGNEMWERFLNLFRDKEIAPRQRWTRDVPNKVCRRFTLIQFACLGAMFAVKESPMGVLFPFLVAMLAPIRYAMEKTNMFQKEHIEILDQD